MQLGYFDINGNALPAGTKVIKDVFGTINVMDDAGHFVATAYETASDAAYWRDRTQAAIVQANTYGVTVGAGQTIQQANAEFIRNLNPTIPTPSAVVATPRVLTATTASAASTQADANMAAIVSAMQELQTAQETQPTTTTPKSSASGVGLLSIIGIAVSLLK